MSSDQKLRKEHVAHILNCATQTYHIVTTALAPYSDREHHVLHNFGEIQHYEGVWQTAALATTFHSKR